MNGHLCDGIAKLLMSITALTSWWGAAFLKVYVKLGAEVLMLQ
jgi:hypothetical protein